MSSVDMKILFTLDNKCRHQKPSTIDMSSKSSVDSRKLSTLDMRASVDMKTVSNLDNKRELSNLQQA